MSDVLADGDEDFAGAPDFTYDRDLALRLIEAAVFASPTPLPTAQLKMLLPDGLAADALLDELRAAYRARGINLVFVAGGWIFRTAPDLASKLAPEPATARKLTRAQIETLAIIAYHQPVTRIEIEEIRGVGLSKGTLDLLMEAGWVEPKGRRETPGRPVTWVTTDGFLRHFGLGGLADLPNLGELKAAGLLDARPVQVLSESARDLNTSDEDYAVEL